MAVYEFYGVPVPEEDQCPAPSGVESLILRTHGPVTQVPDHVPLKTRTVPRSAYSPRSA
jgi:hypothetical protein